MIMLEEHLKTFLKLGFLGFIILLLFVLIKEKLTGKKVKHYSNKEQIKTKMETIYNQLILVENYHRIKQVSSDMLLFMNEYSINLIMTKDYSGNIMINNDMWVLKEGDKDTPIMNIYDEFRSKETGLKFKSGDYNKFLLLGEFCILKKYDPEIEIIRMNNLFFKVNKIEIKKKYTKEEIDEYMDKM